MKASASGFNDQYSDTAPSLDELSAADGKILLEFGAPWCGHCMAAKQAVQELLGTRPGQLHVKVYDGKGKPLGRAFAVKLWPTLLVLENGRELARVVRPTSVADLVPVAQALDH